MNLCIQCWVSDDLKWYCETQKTLLFNHKSYLNSLFDIEFRIWIWAPIPEIIFFLPFFLLSSLKKAVKVRSWKWLGTTFCLPGWRRWISLKALSSWSSTKHFWHHLLKLKRTHGDLCAKWRETWNFKYFKHCNLESQWHWTISVEQQCFLPSDFNTFETGGCILLNSSTFKLCFNLHASK